MKDAVPILCWLAVFLGLFVAPVHAQTVGTCAPAEAEAYLDVNNVRARIFNNGALFYKGNPPVYEVPKGSGKSTLFYANVMVAGRVGGKLRAAASLFNRWEFWPGPLDDAGNPPAHCAVYDRLFEIARTDIETVNETGEKSPNLLDWPWDLGAPVLDGDGNPDNYDLDGGDRPALMGDQMLWWVMNDAGGVHEETGSPPLGLEVHGTAFAFSRQTRSLFNTTTFYRYVLHYKGKAPLDDAYFGVFADVDAGYFGDDYLGSDSLLHMGYVYNADNFDEGTKGYGQAPPALGITFVRGPLAQHDRYDNDRDGAVDEPGERLGMHAFPCTHKNDLSWPGFGGTGDMTLEYHRCLSGLWPYGSPIVFGGTGYSPGFLGNQPILEDAPTAPTTRFVFPSDPTTAEYWSEMNIDGQGTRRSPADRRFFMSSGPFSMQPGEVREFIFAIVWSRGDDHLDSVRQLKKDVTRLHSVAEQILHPDTALVRPTPKPTPQHILGFAQNFPNPFSTSTTIRYSLPQPMHVRLKVFDMLGREVAMLVDERQAPGIYEALFEARNLPGGVYFYRLQLDFLTFTRKMILMQ